MASRGVNKVILVGNCGGNPEIRYTSAGTAVANVTLATSQTWKDKNTGEQQESVEWHRVIFFNRLAEIVNEYVKKGSKLYIEGSLRTRSWEQDGIKRYATEIVAAEFQMLDSKQSHPQDSEARKQPSAEPSPYSGNPSSFDGFDDDPDSIPF